MTPLTFRQLTSEADYAACIELQRVTWGRDFSDAVPMSILKITQKAGGIAAGAFAPDGRLLGFVYGITGIKAGAKAGSPPKIFHWSHMLAVAPEARDLGLGTRLKLYQRELLLDLGVERVEWTYDPLEARNAHLNFNHLGAVPELYVRDMYEGELGSDLAKGIGTDRFIVAWLIASERVARRLAEGPPDPAEVIGRFGGAPVVGPAFPEGEPLPAAPAAPAPRILAGPGRDPGQHPGSQGRRPRPRPRVPRLDAAGLRALLRTGLAGRRVLPGSGRPALLLRAEELTC